MDLTTAANLSPAVRREYARLRDAGLGGRVGFSASTALDAARTLVAFRAEEDETVRLRVEDETDSYWTVYGEPEGYTDGRNGRRVSAEEERKETDALMETYGCLYMVAEYLDAASDEWEHADSVGMLVGYTDVRDPAVCDHAAELMGAALRARAESVADAEACGPRVEPEDDAVIYVPFTTAADWGITREDEAPAEEVEAVEACAAACDDAADEAHDAGDPARGALLRDAAERLRVDRGYLYQVMRRLDVDRTIFRRPPPWARRD